MLRKLGGERLGSGNQMKVAMKNYERSTHNLGNAWRSTLTPGTLVPFYKKLCFNGDTWTIDTNALLHTMPAIGPLFGSYKLQIDFFVAPVRLYQGLLHNNWTKIGLDMSKVKFPKMGFKTIYNDPKIIAETWGEKQQIHPSALLRYLGIKGIGSVINPTAAITQLYREFNNAIPVLAYYDIFKNYYANKQEEYAYVITNSVETSGGTLISGKPCVFNTDRIALLLGIEENAQTALSTMGITTTNTKYKRINWIKPGLIQGVNLKISDLSIYGDLIFDIRGAIRLSNPDLDLVVKNGNTYQTIALNDQNNLSIRNNDDGSITLVNRVPVDAAIAAYDIIGIAYTPVITSKGTPKLTPFKLENIDEMRMEILKATNTLGTAYEVKTFNKYPYQALFDEHTVNDYTITNNKFPMQGLCVKTYQSDVLNNWLSKEWIDGVNGISNITAVDTSSGYFTIDALTLAKKMWTLMNRIAVGGGSYEDWQETVYGEDTTRLSETPLYYGGMSGIISFEEVVSTADTETKAAGDQPLGSLAGKGILTRMKGGHIEIHIKEPSYIIGIVSITPYIDYCDANDFDMTEIASPNDFHKPELDGIGFQNLMLERATWLGKTWDEDTNSWKDNVVGKQPAWIEYMTSKNEVFGDFADPDKLGWMVLCRRYDNKAQLYNGTNQIIPVSDFTTYIDPTKYNYIFADNNLEAMNFWLQIGVNAKSRRKMSAKIMPNL